MSNEQRLERLETVIREVGEALTRATSSTTGASVTASPRVQNVRAAAAPAVVETYIAERGAQRSQFIGAGAGATSAFAIEVRFLGGLTENQKNAFKGAADRWTRVIVGALPSALVDNEVIEGLLILAQGEAIDGRGRILGQAGPTRLRPPSAGAAAFLPVKGEMTFDSADLAEMEQRGTLQDVITHEMGHVLGIGTIWSRKGVIKSAGSSNPTFTGTGAQREYGVLRGNTGPAEVPVENEGGPGTADGHWRETVFMNELMSGFIANPGNPLSRMTVASLGDLGYGVDINGSETYELPDLLAIAEGTAMLGQISELDRGTMLPHIPTVLPEGSML